MGRSEFRVICDPFFKDNESDFLIYRKCYDLIDIGVLRRGIWSFGISIVESDKGMVFKLHGKREPMRGKQQDPNIPRNPVLNKTWEFPLYTDIGANAVHLGNPNETSNAIFSSLWEDVRPPKKKSTNSSRTDDQCHQKREGPHASPRETLVSPEMKYTTSANGPPNQPQARAGSSPTQTAIPGGKASIPSSREETASNETITVTPQYDIV
jgi:hypothetical protein